MFLELNFGEGHFYTKMIYYLNLEINILNKLSCKYDF